jgi:hypothetical protein
MQAHELPRGNAPASPFETRRFAAFLRVRGYFCLLGQLVEATRFSPRLFTIIHSLEESFDFIPK